MRETWGKPRSAGVTVFLLAAVVVVCGWGQNVCARPPALMASQGDVPGFTLEGKISEVEKGKFTVSTEQNIIFHVVYDDKTEIKHPDGSAATAKDFRVGAHVKAAGDFTDSGEIAAKTIEIDKPPDSKPPSKHK